MSEQTVTVTYETFPNKKNNKVYVTISTTDPSVSPRGPTAAEKES
jgi:hypothetical protein